MAVFLAILALLAAGAVVAFRRACRTESRPDRILGLLYHRLVTDDQYARCPPTEKIFSIAAGRFKEQMEYLKREGYSVVTLDAVVDYLKRGTTLPPKPVLVTFDDGCVSVYDQAFPVLRSLGFPAVLFVTTDPASWVFSLGTNAQRRVTEDEMRELEAGGITIGSHAVTHGALESMSEPEIASELGDSKRTLEAVLGHEVRYFAVPLNWYGPKVRQAAERLGYRAVCTSDNGTIHGVSDLFHLKRFIIEGSFPLEEFARNLRAGQIVQRRIINAIKRAPARLLGPRIWLPLRRKLFDSFLGRYFTLKYFKRALAGGVVLLAAIAILVWWVIAVR